MEWQQINRMPDIRKWMFGSKVPHKALFPLNKGDFKIAKTDIFYIAHFTHQLLEYVMRLKSYIFVHVKRKSGVLVCCSKKI